MRSQKKVLFLGIGATIIILVAGGVMWSRHSTSQDELVTDQTGSISSPGDSTQTIDYTEAPKHIGEKLTVKGTVLKVFTTKSGVTFFDYCTSSYSCPFSAVVFASDAPNFKDLNSYTGSISVTGIIKSYQNKAEMVLSDPGQISR